MKCSLHGFALAALSSLLLAACGGGSGSGSGGGGGGGSSPLPLPVASPSQARTITGSSAPTETGAQQRTRGTGIAARADSLEVSRSHFTTRSRALPPLSVDSSCSGTSCTLTTFVNRQAVTERVSVSDLTFPSVPTAVLTKNGITLTQYSDSEIASYGAWLDHSGFAVQSDRGSASGVSWNRLYGIAGGDLTGSAPPTSATATWRGLMVGGVVSNGHAVQGDALLTWADAGSGYRLTAAFSDIKNLDLNQAHSAPSFSFTGMTVASDGTFSQGSGGTRVDGAFYGPSHAEAAGTVEHSGVVGAFGARKQ